LTGDIQVEGRVAFGVVVRTVGLIFMLYGVWCAALWAQYAGGFVNMLPTAVRLQALYLIVAGIMLLRGADSVARFAYPSNNNAA
jgi:hypothetical protein